MDRVSGPLAAAILILLPASSTDGLLVAQTPTFTPAARVCTVRDLNPALADPALPTQIGAMALGDDGLYYTTSPSGGQSTLTANQGTIFQFSPNPDNLFSPATNQFKVLYSFDGVAHGNTPMGGLTKVGLGFYGTTRAGGLFQVNPLDPKAKKFGSGTLFSFEIGDSEPQVVHTFRYGDLSGIVPEVCPPKPQPCHYSPQQRLNAAGGVPLSAPVFTADGLYGVTSGALGFGNLGVLYKVAPYKGESGITALCIGGPMPAPEETPATLPDQKLIEQCMFNAKTGSLPLGLTVGPGHTVFGTTLQASPTSGGSVFKVDLPSGRVTTLYNFPDPKLGIYPYGVIYASDGYLYGITSEGGPLYGYGNAGAGVLFRLSPSGGGFQIVHAFNGISEGSMPVAGLLEVKSPSGHNYLYGSTAGGGATRGVLFRVSLDPIGPSSYEVLYTFPSQWSVNGSFPHSTMVVTNDKTYGLTFFGTTLTGGLYNYGALFRMTGVDLPPMQNLANPVIYSLRSGYKHAGDAFMIPGQVQNTTVDLYAGVVAQSGSTPPADTATDNGVMIKVGNCRSPHIVQFISRQILDADGKTYKSGTYTNSSGRSYPLSTAANPIWDTDSSAKPNAYYDEQHGAPNMIGPLNLTIFDAPNFNGPTYDPNAHESWFARFEDYVFCNCQLVRKVQWSRHRLWLVDHAGPVEYDPVISISPTQTGTLPYINQQVVKDGFQPVP